MVETRRLLGTEDSTVKTVTVGAADVVLSEMKYRKSIYIKNTSAGGQVVTVAFSNNNPAVAGEGFVLAAGEAMVESSSEGYKAWTGRVRAIASGAGATLAIVEQNEDLS